MEIMIPSLTTHLDLDTYEDYTSQFTTLSPGTTYNLEIDLQDLGK